MSPPASIHRFVTSVFSAPAPSDARAARDVTQIHEENADFVWKTLQRLGVRDRDLEDALQEVFIVVHRKLGTFDGSSRMSTWLFGICLRVAAAHRRRAHVRREQPTGDLEESGAAHPGADPEASLLASEARARLHAVLDTLTLEKRAVFVLFEIEGLSAVAIANLVGVPVGTVHSRLSAARTEFKRAAEREAARQRRKGNAP